MHVSSHTYKACPIPSSSSYIQVLQATIASLQKHTISVVQQLDEEDASVEGKSEDMSDRPAMKANIEHMHQQKVGVGLVRVWVAGIGVGRLEEDPVTIALSAAAVLGFTCTYQGARACYNNV